MTTTKTYREFAQQVGDLVLCNNIVNVDYSVFDNMEFSTTDNEELEVYQYFLTNLNRHSVEWFQKHYPNAALFTYSNLLDCYVLCVTHSGTMWDSVPTTFIY